MAGGNSLEGREQKKGIAQNGILDRKCPRNVPDFFL